MGDGSPWIWSLADTLFPHARKLRDFYRLAEHVHEAAKELHGEGSEAAARWAGTTLSRLWAGEVEAVLADLPAEGASELEPLRKLDHHLQANQTRMDYPAFG